MPVGRLVLTVGSYLNCNGVDAEGLYRQSGSIKEIKKWQIKFDTGLSHL